MYIFDQKLNPRTVLGSLVINHLYNLDERQTVGKISENIYLQYFHGYPIFKNEISFETTLFVEFCKRLGIENLNAPKEMIIAHITMIETKQTIGKQSSESTNNEQILTQVIQLKKNSKS